MFEDFEIEFKEQYPNFDFNIIEEIINNLECNFESGRVGEFDISCSVEKIHVLQQNVYIYVKNEKEQIEFFLEYENGINNGTQLNDFYFTDLRPKTKIVEELIDVKFDYEEWRVSFGKKYCETEKINLESIFDINYKQRILKMLNEESYDNYFTGGGTEKTNKYYSELRNELRNNSVFWTCIYEEREVKLCL